VLSLYRGTGQKPEVLAACLPGAGGLANGRAVCELLGTVVAEGIATGWVVSPAGFTSDARMAAAEHGVRLIDGPDLIAGLAEVPPHTRMRVVDRLEDRPKPPPLR
jgi:hypothetical protein